MSITTHATITTKPETFDEFHQYIKVELAMTRESAGCRSIHCSSDKETNTLKFVGVWDDIDSFNAYSERRQERSGEIIARLLAEDGMEVVFHNTDDWGYGSEYKSSDDILTL